MRSLVVLLVPAVLWTAELKIDHVTVAGADLKKIQARLESVGLHSVYGGPHSNHATEMSLVSFPDGSYLELMGVQPNADPKAVAAHDWAKFLKSEGTPCAWAVRLKDIAAEVKRLQAAGIPVNAPQPSGRRRPDGVELKWQTSDVGDRGRGSFFPFMIQDLTPRDQRAYPTGKPVTRDFRGITRVVIAVRSLPDAIAEYRKAYGLPAAIKQVDPIFGAQLALLGAAPILLAQPLRPDSWLAARLEQYGEGPCAFLLGQSRGKYPPATTARWFGIDISWFDAETLGWRLGYESVQ